MPAAGQVFVEALVIGVAFVLLFGTVHLFDMAVRPGPKGLEMQRHASPAMNHVGLGMQAFAAGFIGHVAFEIAGFNRSYCAQYK